MSRRPATRKRPPAVASDGPNPKAPCPCGSGRRYKACHGSDYPPVNERPFAGTPSECDWVALRELVPSATAPLTLADGRTATLGTVLPMAAPAMHRKDGEVLVATQVPVPSLEPGRDLADVLVRAFDAPADSTLDYRQASYDAPTLADVLGPDPLEVTVHEDFTWWLHAEEREDPQVVASLERANDTVFPSARLESVEAAYWCLPGDKAHLRWVMPHPEDRLLDALARLSAAGTLGLGDETRFAGSFRAQGLLVPVWDLPTDAHHREWEDPARQMLQRIEEALAVEEPLGEAERRARAGLIGRQITLR